MRAVCHLSPVCARLRLLCALSLGAIGGALPMACALFDAEAGEKSRLADAKARWSTHGHNDYEFGLNHAFSEGSPYSLLIRVRGGQVAEVFEGGVPVPPDYRTRTVPELFTMIRGWLDESPHRFSAMYDAELGYPVYVSIDHERNTIDDGEGFGVSGLTPIPPLPAASP